MLTRLMIDFLRIAVLAGLLWVVGGVPAGAGGRVLVLREDGFEGMSAEAAPADAEELGGLFESGGWEVRLISGAQMGDAGVLNGGACDLLVLPYGPNFPQAAAGNFREYLKQRGKLITMGGYACANVIGGSTATMEITEQWLHVIDDVETLRGHGDLRISGWMKPEAVEGGGIAFMNLYQYDASDRLVTHVDYASGRGGSGWKRHEAVVGLDARTARIRLGCGFYNAFGTASFDRIRLETGDGRLVFEDDFTPGTVTPGRYNTQHLPVNWAASGAEYCGLFDDSAPGGEGLCLQVSRTADRLDPLSSRYGKAGDDLLFSAEQLTLFDRDQRYGAGDKIRAAAGQFVFEGEFDPAGAIEGWSAVSIVGSDRARWIPLLEVVDRYGGRTGTAGAMLQVHPTPGVAPTTDRLKPLSAFTGAGMGFFGVTSHDLFRPENRGLREGLLNLADRLVRGVFLRRVRPVYFSYRAGETVQIRVVVANNGKRGAAGRLTVQMLEADREEVVLNATRNYSVAAGSESGEVTVGWPLPAGAGPFYRIRVRLGDENGAPVDEYMTGFYVWSDEVIGRGPRLEFRDNFYHFDGRARFVVGTDQNYEPVSGLLSQNPLRWREDAAKRRDAGLRLFEVLQSISYDSEERWRNVDALIQSCQMAGQVYMPMLTAKNIVVSNEELERDAAYVRAFAERYRNVPGLIYYLQGDLQVVLENTAQIRALFNEFLTGKYGTDAALRAGWGAEAPGEPLGQVRVENYQYYIREWKSAKSYDYFVFQTGLIRRWTERLRDEIRKVDSVHPVLVEHYDWPYNAADMIWSTGGMDVCNNGFFFKRLNEFPATAAYSDLRARGKSFGIGEFGGKTHPAFRGVHEGLTREDRRNLFDGVIGVIFGMGGSHVQNWQWNDSDVTVFPWGLNQLADLVPRASFFQMRNMALFTGLFTPRHRPAEIGFLTADNFRAASAQNGEWAQTHHAVLKGIEFAQAAHVGAMTMLNETEPVIPEGTRFVFYPLPYFPPDAVYERLLRFVREGGTLYISGDLSYDLTLKRTKTERLRELCGVNYVAQRYPGISVTGQETYREIGNETNVRSGYPCIRIEPTTAQTLWRTAGGEPVVVRNRAGSGQVIYSTDPVELASPEGMQKNADFYQWLLRQGGREPVGLEPDEAGLRVFRQEFDGGESVFVLLNFERGRALGTFTLRSGGHAYQLQLRPEATGILWINAAGEVLGVKSQGEVRQDGRPLAELPGDGLLFTVDRTALEHAAARVFLPAQPGDVVLPGMAAAEFGEIRDGAWRSLEVRAAEGPGLTLDEAQARRIVIIGDDAARADAARRLVCLTGEGDCGAEAGASAWKMFSLALGSNGAAGRQTDAASMGHPSGMRAR